MSRWGGRAGRGGALEPGHLTPDQVAVVGELRADGFEVDDALLLHDDPELLGTLSASRGALALDVLATSAPGPFFDVTLRRVLNVEDGRVTSGKDARIHEVCLTVETHPTAGRRRRASVEWTRIVDDPFFPLPRPMASQMRALVKRDVMRLAPSLDTLLGAREITTGPGITHARHRSITVSYGDGIQCIMEADVDRQGFLGIAIEDGLVYQVAIPVEDLDDPHSRERGVLLALIPALSAVGWRHNGAALAARLADERAGDGEYRLVTLTAYRDLLGVALAARFVERFSGEPELRRRLVRMIHQRLPHLGLDDPQRLEIASVLVPDILRVHAVYGGSRWRPRRYSVYGEPGLLHNLLVTSPIIGGGLVAAIVAARFSVDAAQKWRYGLTGLLDSARALDRKDWLTGTASRLRDTVPVSYLMRAMRLRRHMRIPGLHGGVDALGRVVVSAGEASTRWSAVIESATRRVFVGLATGASNFLWRRAYIPIAERVAHCAEVVRRDNLADEAASARDESYRSHLAALRFLTPERLATYPRERLEELLSAEEEHHSVLVGLLGELRQAGLRPAHPHSRGAPRMTLPLLRLWGLLVGPLVVGSAAGSAGAVVIGGSQAAIFGAPQAPTRAVSNALNGPMEYLLGLDQVKVVADRDRYRYELAERASWRLRSRIVAALGRAEEPPPPVARRRYRPRNLAYWLRAIPTGLVGGAIACTALALPDIRDIAAPFIVNAFLSGPAENMAGALDRVLRDRLHDQTVALDDRVEAAGRRFEAPRFVQVGSHDGDELARYQRQRGNYTKYLVGLRDRLTDVEGARPSWMRSESLAERVWREVAAIGDSNYLERLGEYLEECGDTETAERGLTALAPASTSPARLPARIARAWHERWEGAEVTLCDAELAWRHADEFLPEELQFARRYSIPEYNTPTPGSWELLAPAIMALPWAREVDGRRMAATLTAAHLLAEQVAYDGRPYWGDDDLAALLPAVAEAQQELRGRLASGEHPHELLFGLVPPAEYPAARRSAREVAKLEEELLGELAGREFYVEALLDVVRAKATMPAESGDAAVGERPPPPEQHRDGPRPQ